MPAHSSRWLGLALLSASVVFPVSAQQDNSTAAVTTAAPAVSGTAYISDRLVTYLYNGPGKDYKIIASINAGDEIQLTGEDATAGYWQVTDSKGRTGWILKQYVSASPVFDQNTEQLTTQLNNLQSQIEALAQEKQQLQQELEETAAAVTQAEAATATAQQTIALLTTQLQDKPTSFWQDKMVMGALLAIAGLILGLLVPALLPQRRRNDRWM
ncbi:TIGR04211 family SH3 domain-containing protein [Rheinheimera sp.]|uniref:TIGR04211 family SH3 domain-containing protein n=1 Tax=Rheinheimera sp. TaxID=1869214 RepID=UPI00307D2C1E